jgi:uncharacterized iron-regulated membrane protein
MANGRAAETREIEGRGALYRMLWRWHFYAGLVCMPFVVWLALTGSIYLFRPQIDAWVDRDVAALARTGTPETQAETVAAATAAVPGSTFAGVMLPEHADQAARVLVARDGVRTRVYLHPDTLDVLKTIDEGATWDRWIFQLHGELMLGTPGSLVVELAASWAIVMILTGLYLWWPRNAKGLGGVLYPRIGQGAKRFWRDLHAVTGVWVSTLALFLLSSGMPWALVWGNSFKLIREWTGNAPITQDWIIGPSGGEHAEHGGHDAQVVDHSAHGGPGVDQVYASARALNLAPPVILTPPTKASPYWWAKSNSQNRPLRQDVAFDAMSGELATRDLFANKHIIDQVVGVMIAAHEGQLFPPLNQVLGVLTAAGVVTLCISAFVMWRRRAPEGVLGAPPPIPEARIGFGLGAIILAAAILLPMLGTSLIVIALLERGVLARWPSARRWLGLQSA